MILKLKILWVVTIAATDIGLGLIGTQEYVRWLTVGFVIASGAMMLWLHSCYSHRVKARTSWIDDALAPYEEAANR